jgi:hypothetical protein
MPDKPAPIDMITLHAQGHQFGEVVAELVAKGLPITDVLTQVLGQGPLTISEATAAARALRMINLNRVSAA